MFAEVDRRLIVIFAVTATVAACSDSGLKSGVDAKDAPATAYDLRPAADLIVAGPDAWVANRDAAQDPAVLEKDASGDATPAERDAAQESVVPGKDAARDTSPAPVDALRSDATAPGDGGGPLACQQNLGGLSPLVEDDVAALALADVNGDGRLDAVSGFAVWLGQGDGSFGSAVGLPNVSETLSVALGDLDNDGKLDIITVGYSAHTARVLLGRGDGTFTARPDVTLGGESGYVASPVTLADVDGDGKLDILTADSLPNTSADNVWVMLGHGDGTFAAPHKYPTHDGPDVVVAGDVDGDGKPDMIVINHCAVSADVLLNQGDGTFMTKQQLTLGNGGCPMVKSARLADVNQDRKLDLVVAGVYPGTVVLLLGGGDGTFASPENLANREYLRSMALVDLDADGKLDLLLAQAGLSVLMGKGDGTFAPAMEFPAGNDVTAALPGDLDGDGRIDVYLSFGGDSNAHDESVWFGKGDGTFASYPTYPVGGDQASFALADVNADGKPDLVTANRDKATVSVLLGKGDGSLAGAHDFASGATPQQVGLGDIDGDGKLDVVTASTALVSVLLGAGDGSFAAKADYAGGEGAVAMALGDLDGDGRTDVVRLGAEAAANHGSVDVLLGTGTGKLTAYLEYPVGMAPLSLAVGDLNGDGKPDVAVANAGADGGWSLGVLLGTGKGTLAAMTVAWTARVSTLAIADMNRDGKLDIVAGDDWSASVTVLLGKGDGTFAVTTSTVKAWDDPRALLVLDWDGDGVPDVLASGDSTTVLLGKGDGTFAGRLVYPVSTSSLASADLDGDGRPDLVARAGVSLVGVLLHGCR